MSDTIEFDPKYEFSFYEEVCYDVAGEQSDLVILLAKKLKSDCNEYLSCHEDAKKALSVMPKDYMPDYASRAQSFLRDERVKGFALEETKVRRQQLKDDIKRLRRELLALSEALDHVPEVC